MTIDIDNIDVEKLRQDLINYYGSAAYMVNPVAFMDVLEVERLSDEEVIKKALINGINLEDYYVEKEEDEEKNTIIR